MVWRPGGNTLPLAWGNDMNGALSLDLLPVRIWLWMPNSLYFSGLGFLKSQPGSITKLCILSLYRHRVNLTHILKGSGVSGLVPYSWEQDCPTSRLEHCHLIPHLTNLNRNSGFLGQVCLALPGPLPKTWDPTSDSFRESEGLLRGLRTD